MENITFATVGGTQTTIWVKAITCLILEDNTAELQILVSSEWVVLEFDRPNQAYEAYIELKSAYLGSTPGGVKPKRKEKPVKDKFDPRVIPNVNLLQEEAKAAARDNKS